MAGNDTAQGGGGGPYGATPAAESGDTLTDRRL